MTRDSGRWLSVRTRTGEEFFAETDLRKHGFDVFAPWELRQRPAFKRTIVEKVGHFPGYIFARVGEGRTVFMVGKMHGVIGVVTNGLCPIPISEHIMGMMRGSCTCDGYWPPAPGPAVAGPTYDIGAVVMIQSGPFAGLPGEVVRLDEHGGLVLSLDIFGRATHVACSQDAVALTEAEPA